MSTHTYTNTGRAIITDDGYEVTLAYLPGIGPIVQIRCPRSQNAGQICASVKARPEDNLVRSYTRVIPVLDRLREEGCPFLHDQPDDDVEVI